MIERKREPGLTGEKQDTRSSKGARKKRSITRVATHYEPTPQEHAVAKTYFAKREQRAPCPGLKVCDKRVTVDHPDGNVGWLLLTQALGAADYAFAGILVSQLASTVLSTQPDSMKTDALNSMLAAVKAIEPRDEIEAMLAAQMAAIHNATMQMASRLATVNGLQQAESAERGLNKLARTFTLQVEALKRLRSGGEQKVRVEHVHVHEGGQAIVGNVEGR